MVQSARHRRANVLGLLWLFARPLMKALGPDAAAKLEEACLLACRKLGRDE